MSDSYFPYVFDLSSGNVQEIHTGQADPRVIFNRHGLIATDPTGAQLFDLNADTGSASFKGTVTSSGLIIPADVGSLATTPTRDRVQWQRTLDGAVIAEILGNANTAPGTPASNYAVLDAYSGSATPTDQATVYLQAGKSSILDWVIRMYLTSMNSNPPTGSIVAQGPSGQARIMDESNRASFVQIGDAIRQGAYGIRRLGGAARAYRSVAMNFPANAWGTVPVSSVTYDVDNAFTNPSTRVVDGSYYAPWAGTYLIAGQVAANSTAANQQLAAGLNKNGALTAQGSLTVSAAAGNYMSAQVVTLVPLNVGENVELTSFTSAALAASISPNNNYLCVIPIN